MATVTVRDYERVVRLVRGRVLDVLGPGQHRYRARNTELHRVDVRPAQLVVPGQDVLTTDGVMVRVTVVLRVAVSDPVAHLTQAQHAQGEVYAAAQQVLRAAVAGLSLAELLGTRNTLGPELLAEVRSVATRVGLSVEELAVRDVMLPGELRRAYTDAVLAREQGRAELERARAEAATLRSLANTARLLEEHPALLRLRTLQLAGQHGTQLRLTVSD